MRNWRKLLILICLFAMASLSGCVVDLPNKSAYVQYEADQKILYVAFSVGGEEADPFDYTTIKDYQSVFAPYNSYLLYDTLNDAEQQVYRFLEYALDHSYTTIFIDERLLADTTLPVKEILEFLCMDSPFAEQNYNYSRAETSYTFSYLEGKYSFEVPGTELEVNFFSKDKLEKKKEALEAAKQLLQSAPQDASDLETARWIYRYLTENVSYHTSEQENENTHYLYNALVQKQTQCDGFANTFSLLCQLSGIPCIEKIYSPETDGIAGHTWNCFLADGVWYNADCALSQGLVEDQHSYGIDFRFAFSDQRQEYAPIYPERLPECSTDLIPTECILPSPDAPEMIDEIRAAFDRTTQDYILVRFDEGKLPEGALQTIVDDLQFGLHSLLFTWGEKSHYFLFKR